MLNPSDVGLLREMQKRINYALHEDLAAENSQSSAWCDTGDGVHMWFLWTIAEADLGIHQYPAICERLGCQPDDEMSISIPSVWIDFLDRLSVPVHCSLAFDYWPNGGCYGLILSKTLE